MSISVGVLLALALVSAVQERDSIPKGVEHQIGSKGAVLVLDSQWTRKTIDPTAGDDQFVRDQNQFMVVVELQGLLSHPESYFEKLEIFVTLITTKLHDVTMTNPQFERLGDLGHAWIQFSGKTGSLSLAYRIDLLSRDGLTYVLMSWGSQRQFFKVYFNANKAANAVKFPGPESEWAKATVAKTRVVELSQSRLEVSIAPGILADADLSPDAFLSLVSPGGNLTAFFFHHSDTSNAAQTLDDTAVVLSGNLGSTRQIELGNVEATQAEIAIEDPTGPTLVCQTNLIPFEDTDMLELRFCAVEFARYQQWTDPLIKSFTIKPLDLLDAFPVPVVTSMDEVPPANLRPIIEAADLIGSLGAEGIGRFAVSADGEFVLSAGQSISRVSPGSGDSPKLIDQWGDWRPAPDVGFSRDGVVLSVSPEGKLIRIDEDGSRAMGVAAQRFTIGTDGSLIVARRQQAAVLPGLDALAAAAPTKLVHIAESGEEDVLMELSGRNVEHLAAWGNLLLVVSSVVDPWRNESISNGVRVELISMQDRSIRVRNQWDQVNNVTNAQSGWLMTGKPRGGSSGLYRIDPTGESRKVLHGDGFIGMGLNDDRLLVAMSQVLADGYQTEWRLYGLSMEAVHQLQLPAAIELETMRRIAVASVRAAKLDENPLIATIDRTAMTRLLEAADQVAEEMTVGPLPAIGNEIDAMIQSYYNDKTSVGIETEILLAALVARALMKEGNAEWVDGSHPYSENLRYPQEDIAEGPFAMAFLPLAAVRSTLYDADGWWQPTKQIQETAEGRVIVVGGDISTTDERVSAYGALNLDSDSMDSVKQAMESARDNLFLRRQVYRWLAGAGRFEELEKLAEELVESGSGPALDRKIWLAAREHLLKEQAIGPLIADLKQAIREEPNDASLYLLLGRAYERLPEDIDKARARACFRKVLQLQSWGDLPTEARAALKRLEIES